MRLGLLLISLVCALGAYGVDYGKDMARAKKLMEQQRWKAATTILRKLSENRKLEDRQRGIASTLLARSYRRNGEFKDALAVLEGTRDGRPLDFNLELGETLLALKRYEKALDAAGSYLVAGDAVSRVKARWVSARANFGLGRYLKCMEDCDAVIRGLRREKGETAEGLADFKIDASVEKEIADLRGPAIKTRREARRANDIQAYGRDFANYRDAREADFAGDYETALAAYGEIKSGTLRDAADCYSAACLAKSNRLKEASAIYAKLDKDPGFMGPYRGEAFYDAATMTYREDRRESAAGDAAKFIESLRQWARSVRQEKKVAELVGINDALRADIVDETPKEYCHSDDCGNLVRTKRYPESIVNHLTAPWYLPSLATKGELFYGYLLGEMDETDSAARAYRDAAELGEGMKIIRDPEMVPALLAGLIDGIYLLPEKLGKRISGKHKKDIHFACYSYTVDESAEALAIFERLLKDPEVKSHDRGAALLGQAYCLIDAGRLAEAEGVLKSLRDGARYKRSLVGREARYLSGCLYAARDKRQAYRFFESLMFSRRLKNSELAARATLARAVCAVNADDSEKAVTACDFLLKKFKDTPYAKSAQTLKEAVENRPAGNLLAPVETENGKVALHKRTIVMPGTTCNWAPDFASLTAGDILLYDIHCVARDECSIIRSFNMRLSPMEPGPAASRGARLVFARAPLLFAYEARYDFSGNFPELFPKAELSPETEDETTAQ